MSRFFSTALSALEPYVPGEQPKNIKNLIKLNTNESPFPPSPKVLEAVNTDAVSRLRLYSDPECLILRRAVAKRFSLESDNVLVGNGSDEILAFLFQGFCENGAAFADITYGFYPVFAGVYSLESEIIPLRDDFSLAVDDYEGINKTVFVANPNAPTGLCLPLGEIERLLLQNKNRLVVIDEAYVDFGGESAVSLIKNYDNLVVVGTFSKSRSLAGARLGFALASEELIADMNKIKFSFNPYNVNSLTLLAGTAAIEDEAYFDSCRKRIIENRGFLTASLEAMGFTVPDSRANFIFAGGNKKIGGKAYYSALREKGILVRHFDKERIADYVRITVGTREQVEALITATKEILSAEETK